MSTSLAVQNSGFPTPAEVQSMKDIAVHAFNSGLLPKSIDTKEKALIIVMKSRALGIDPMHGLWSISVINGKPCMSAELMLAVIHKHIPGFRVDYLKTDNSECTLEAQRPGGKATKFSFTLEDAKRAQIYKNVWLTYPAAMLRARAISAMARAMAPDALAGAIYTPEEMGADVDEDGNVRDVTPTDDDPRGGGKQTAPKTESKDEPKPTPQNHAAASDPRAEAIMRKAEQFTDQGDFVIKFGKYAKSKISEIKPDELEEYITHMLENVVEDGSWTQRHLIDMKQALEVYKAQRGIMTAEDKLNAKADEMTARFMEENFDFDRVPGGVK